MTDQTHRLIVVANRTCPCPGLIDEVAARTLKHGGEVLVIAPALNSRLKHWLSDTDAALTAARERLHLAVTHLRDAGVQAAGEIGDADPLTAIDDALHAFAATAIIISTWPQGTSHWLERDLLARAQDRYDIPVEHLVSRYDAPVAIAS